MPGKLNLEHYVSLVVILILYAFPLYYLYFYFDIFHGFQKAGFAETIINVSTADETVNDIFVKIVLPILVAVSASRISTQIFSPLNLYLLLFFIVGVVLTYLLNADIVIEEARGTNNNIAAFGEDVPERLRDYALSVRDAFVTSIAILLGISVASGAEKRSEVGGGDDSGAGEDVTPDTPEKQQPKLGGDERVPV